MELNAIKYYLVNNFINFDNDLFIKNYSNINNHCVYIFNNANDFNIDINKNKYYIIFVKPEFYDIIFNKYINENVEIKTNFIKLLEIRYPEYNIIKYEHEMENIKNIKSFIKNLNSIDLNLILMDSISYKTYINYINKSNYEKDYKNNLNTKNYMILDINYLPVNKFKTFKINKNECKYNIDDLPLIYSFDPLCILNRFEKNDIIKIIRPDGIYYRKVF